jgi:S1-C subfamily serine protease
LGIAIISPLDGGGVVAATVNNGGPADKAGIRPHDVIVKVNGKPTPSADELATVLADLAPGQTVPVEIKRAGKTMTLDVTLGENRG